MSETVHFKMPEPRISRRMSAVIDKVLQDKPPTGTLYHYTTLEGLSGILDSGTMWASDLGFLDDTEEITYGTTVIHDHVSDCLERTPDTIVKLACKSIQGAAEFRRNSWKVPYSRCFAFSLCEADNLRTQWECYALNHGVSIGFSSEALVVRAEAQWFKFIQCRYQPKEQEALVDRLVETLVAEARLASEPETYLTDGSTETSGWNEWSIPGVMVLAATFKRKGFADEREWRAVAAAEALAGPRTKFRIRGGELIPYLEFGLGGDRDPFSVDRVLIGPGPNQELRELAVGGLVRQAESKHTGDRRYVKIERSSL